ncbi:methyltransferase domain-containing protein [Cognatiyoonia sp. IB215446]|uniref:class I SAM-dependent methyltransferase n=1 Tax=Cognatiyoonia sp. IB215446 TaxID=3097355 RepID=UPI002A16F973|nr:methyltransferase domain-containing protein [Cognatiyoonia sp. IB215446]MDX8346960.1 methyltransferase domain-containing protein [Cognatiyoonia sp. IB215446]
MECATKQQNQTLQTYERLAPTYDQLHQRWLRFSGGEAQAALEAAVRVAMNADTTLLDAGCGTGRFARRLLSEGVRPEQITLLDPSWAMLAHSADLPVEKTRGRFEALPFAAASFDIVTCAWAIETVFEPSDAVDELCRVLRPGGLLCLTFCAEKSERSILDRIMQARLAYRRTGRFLDIDTIKAQVSRAMNCDVQILPSSGPAATLIARRKRL